MRPTVPARHTAPPSPPQPAFDFRCIPADERQKRRARQVRTRVGVVSDQAGARRAGTLQPRSPLVRRPTDRSIPPAGALSHPTRSPPHATLLVVSTVTTVARRHNAANDGGRLAGGEAGNVRSARVLSSTTVRSR